MDLANTSTIDLSQIKAEAERLGFSACGIVRAEAVDAATQTVYEQYQADGRLADMDYLARYPHLRFDPTQLLPGCRTIVCVALNYYPAQPLPADTYQIAYYAYGRDYHDVLRTRLHQLADAITGGNPSAYRVCTDTAPILERYWAVRSGIGFIGRNHTLIIPRLGSYFFLGEILTTLETNPQPVNPELSLARQASCTHCHRCIDACPTGALRADGTFDARLCLSYLTIEHRGPFTPEQQQMVASQPTPYYIYGCDRCQQACPHNCRPVPTAIPELQPHPMLHTMTPERWQQLTPDDYRLLFKGSAVKRAKYDGLVRNIQAVALGPKPVPSL